MLVTVDDVIARLVKGALQAVMQLTSAWGKSPGLNFSLPSNFILEFSAISIFRRVKSPSILILEKTALSQPWTTACASDVASGLPLFNEAIPLLTASQADCSKPDSISQLRSACAFNCSQSSFAASALAMQLARSASCFVFWRLRAASQMGSSASLTQRLFRRVAKQARRTIACVPGPLALRKRYCTRWRRRATAMLANDVCRLKWLHQC